MFQLVFDPMRKPVRRLQLVELEDLPWFPRVVRDGGTDWLRFMADLTRVFDRVAPLIRAAMGTTGTTRVIDLCSGGGGPWRTLAEALAEQGDVEVELTDLYPNAAAASLTEGVDHLTFRSEPVDATNVPEELTGVRTMFNCFHHFRPQLARAILDDAVRKRRAIAVFEGVDKRLLPILGMPLQVLAVFLLTPWVRPHRLSRLLLTYVVPLIPALIFFDGIVSMLRIYQPDELRELVADVPGNETFTWDIGVLRVPRSPIGITYLVGTPISM